MCKILSSSNASILFNSCSRHIARLGRAKDQKEVFDQLKPACQASNQLEALKHFISQISKDICNELIWLVFFLC